MVGESSTAGQGSLHAFHTAPNRPIDPASDDLGTLGGDTSRANAINNQGDVVGTSETPVPGQPHAFLFQAGKMIDLHSLVGLDRHWFLEDAHDINDRGEILAIARADWPHPAGPIRRTFVLTPVPDLTVLAVLMMGTVAGASGLAVSKCVRLKSLQSRSHFRVHNPMRLPEEA